MSSTTPEPDPLEMTLDATPEQVRTEPLRRKPEDAFAIANHLTAGGGAAVEFSKLPLSEQERRRQERPRSGEQRALAKTSFSAPSLGWSCVTILFIVIAINAILDAFSGARRRTERAAPTLSSRDGKEKNLGERHQGERDVGPHKVAPRD
jgi:hypothetical protein